MHVCTRRNLRRARWVFYSAVFPGVVLLCLSISSLELVRRKTETSHLDRSIDRCMHAAFKSTKVFGSLTWSFFRSIETRTVLPRAARELAYMYSARACAHGEENLLYSVDTEKKIAPLSVSLVFVICSTSNIPYFTALRAPQRTKCTDQWSSHLTASRRFLASRDWFNKFWLLPLRLSC